jgi:hypothetical protein
MGRGAQSSPVLYSNALAWPIIRTFDLSKDLAAVEEARAWLEKRLNSF